MIDPLHQMPTPKRYFSSWFIWICFTQKVGHFLSLFLFLWFEIDSSFEKMTSIQHKHQVKKIFSTKNYLTICMLQLDLLYASQVIKIINANSSTQHIHQNSVTWAQELGSRKQPKCSLWTKGELGVHPLLPSPLWVTNEAKYNNKHNSLLHLGRLPQLTHNGDSQASRQY